MIEDTLPKHLMNNAIRHIKSFDAIPPSLARELMATIYTG